VSLRKARENSEIVGEGLGRRYVNLTSNIPKLARRVSEEELTSLLRNTPYCPKSLRREPHPYAVSASLTLFEVALFETTKVMR